MNCDNEFMITFKNNRIWPMSTYILYVDQTWNFSLIVFCGNNSLQHGSCSGFGIWRLDIFCNM